MKKQLLFLAFVLFSTLLTAQEKETGSITAAADKILAGKFSNAGPGVAVLVAKNGKVLYEKAVGMASLELGVPLQTDHVFRIGSITKQFTAIAILQLEEQGKLSVRDEITRFLPDYPTQGHKITIEHLLTHTSGIHSYTDMPDFIDRLTLDLEPSAIIDHFKDQPMDFSPGTKWKYSNSGYFLLGYIIEKVSGKPYPQYLQDHILGPLNLTRTFYGSDTKIIKGRAGAYERSDSGSFENAGAMSMTQPYAAGSIQSTVGDLLTWHQAVMSGKLVKKSTLEKAFASHRLLDGSVTSYGYGWRLGYVQGSRTLEHGGGINGFRTVAMYLPEQDVFVTVLSNCGCIAPEETAARLAALAVDKPYEHSEILVDLTTLSGYEGVYENAAGDQRIISVSDGKLYSQRGRNPGFQIKAWEKDAFFFDNALLAIRFLRDKAGKPEKLITQSREGDDVWLRTDKPVAVLPELKLDEKILESYVGEYVVSSDFSFLVTREQNRIFVQATGQPKFEMFAETDSKFYLRINDAQLGFVKDDTGKVTKAVLSQGGRKTDAIRKKP